MKLKGLVEDAIGLRFSKIMMVIDLVQGDTVLDDAKKISDYGIQDNDVIFCRKYHPGAKPPVIKTQPLYVEKQYNEIQ